MEERMGGEEVEHVIMLEVGVVEALHRTHQGAACLHDDGAAPARRCIAICRESLR